MKIKTYLIQEPKCQTCVHKDACELWVQHGMALHTGFKDTYDLSECPTYEPLDKYSCGRWKCEMDDVGWNKWTCPSCGFVKRTDIHVSLGWNYCPHCGVRLVGGM